MANLGLSNTHVNPLNSSAAAKRLVAARTAAGREKLKTAFHVVLFFAAFLFVAAIVCGVLG